MKLPGITKLTVVWLLTPDVSNSHGSLRLEPCRGHEDLAAYLTDCRRTGKRDVRAIEPYFARKPFRFNSFGSDLSKAFGDHRDAYFALIDQAWLRQAVVFLDPDNGMEPAGGAKSAHVTYRELRGLFDRMDESSVAVVYQHLPRRVAAVFWEEVAAKIATALEATTFYVAQSDVAFFVVAKSPSRLGMLEDVLRRFAAAETFGGLPLARTIGVSQISG